MAKNKLSPPPQDLIKQAVASKIARMKVEKIAQRLDARLRADDPRLGGYVYVTHLDGTNLFFTSAFASEL